MKVKFKKVLASLMVLSILLLISSCSKTENKESAKVEQSNTKIVTDMAGRKVTVPKDPKRVATFVGPGYEKVILLGETDKIVLTGFKNKGWASVVAPQLKNIQNVKSAREPNMEELLNKDVQVVFYWDTKDQIKKMESSGIPVVATQVSAGKPTTSDEFIEFEKREVKVFGDTLGENATKKAEEWCKYFDERVNYVKSRISTIPKEKYPEVYYVRGPEATKVHGKGSYTDFLVELAGGNLVTADGSKETLYDTTLEQVIKWDPEYIFMGRVDNTDLIMKNKAWKDIKAVKENKVFVNPNGVMEWDYSSENILLLQFIAKTLHPELFKDLDMKKEIKTYYDKFYNYKLTDDEVTRVINHQSPAKN